MDTIQPRDVNKMSEVTKFKREIIKKIYETPDIIQMLECPDVDPETPDTAEWTCIFPYIRIPGVQESVANYIGVKVDTASSLDNDAYKEATMIISIICALDTLYVEGYKGVRTDIIGGDITELLNRNTTMGFEIKLAEEIEGVFENFNYYYRNLKFTALKTNDMPCGKNKHQRKRKIVE